MSVLVPIIDSINGELRKIYLKQGVSDFYPIEDIYHEYRYLRRTDESLRKWAPLLRAEGNVPKGAGAFTPRYVVLLDGTKIVPYDEPLQINQLGDMITDNPDVDPLLYDISGLTTAKPIFIKPSEAETIQLNNASIVFSSFQGSVWYDSNSVYSDKGTASEPNGNTQRPVNDLELCEEILADVGLRKLTLVSDAVITTGHNFNHITIVGESHVDTQLQIELVADVVGVKIKNLDISGHLDGENEVSDSIIRNISYFNGHIHDSSLGGIIILGGSTESFIENCSRLENETMPVIDFDDEGNHLVMPGYSGMVKLTSFTHASADALIGLNQGVVILDTAAMAAGSISTSGIGMLVDELGNEITSGIWNGVTINNMLISNVSIARTTWNSKTSDFIASGTFGAEAVANSAIKDLQILIEEQRESHTGTGNIYYVDPVNGDSYANGNDGSFSKPLASVQDCHDNLVVDSHHDIITLIAGNSSGITILDEQVTLTKNYTFIRGPGRDFLWKTSSPGDLITITGAGIELKSFQLVTHTVGVGDGIKITGADFARIENVWVGQTRGHGISINNSSTIIVVKCSLQNCGVSGAGHGISVDPSGGVTQGVLITDSYFSHIQGDGITVKSSNVEHVIIENNKFHHCSGWGVNINSDTLNTFVTLNTFGGNTSGNIQDNGTGTTSINNEQWGTVDGIWDEPIDNHLTSGSVGHYIRKKLLSLANFIGLK